MGERIIAVAYARRLPCERVKATGAGANGYVPTNLTMMLIDFTATVFEDNTLPPDLDLGDFEVTVANIIFQKLSRSR